MRRNTHVLKHTWTMIHTFVPQKERTSIANAAMLSLESVTALPTHVGRVHSVTSITSVTLINPCDFCESKSIRRQCESECDYVLVCRLRKFTGRAGTWAGAPGCVRLQ